ncbi:MAG: hypothetical protein ACREPV_01225 [Lysobacter sp.]
MSPALLPLPVTPAQFLQHIVPAAMALLPQRMDSLRARLLLLAICMQESALADRRQGTDARPGPARGLPQFEVNGVIGVMRHVASQDAAKRVCRQLGIRWDAHAIHQAMETNDVLAVAFARLLLWTDRNALPAPGDIDPARHYYLRNWRPGAARTPEGLREIESRWCGNYPQALAAVTA